MWNVEVTRYINGMPLYQFVNDKSGYCLDLPDYGTVPAGTPLCTVAPRTTTTSGRSSDRTPPRRPRALLPEGAGPRS